MPRTKKINEMKQVDGRLIEPTITTSTNASKKVTAQTLDQLWGDDGLWKYKTMDVGEYEKQLNEMNAADVRDHAIKLGFMPIENTERLKGRLINEFRKFVGSYNKPESVGLKVNGRPVSKDVMNILAEAK